MVFFNVVQTNKDISRVYNALKAEIPECILSQHHSLKKIDPSILEKCSLVDMLICQFLMRIMELWNGELPDVFSMRKRKNRNSIDEVTFAIPIVGFLYSFHLVSCVKTVLVSNSFSYAF